jgi:hypothetical protein
MAPCRLGQNFFLFGGGGGGGGGGRRDIFWVAREREVPWLTTHSCETGLWGGEETQSRSFRPVITG